MQLSNCAGILARVASEKEQLGSAASKNTSIQPIIECFGLLGWFLIAQVGIDARGPFFSRRIR